MSQLVNRSFDGESLITPEAISGEIFADRNDNFEEHFSSGKADVALILSVAIQQFENGRPPQQIIHQVAGRLHKIREKYDSGVWKELIPLIQSHEVSEYFLEDPFTYWSHEKPRGYSGDAQLLDFIYGHPSVQHRIDTASPIGAALYEYTKDASSSVAVRERRDILTRHVDDIAGKVGSETEILTIAAGHLREANGSVALGNGGIKRWVALDQDPLSIGAITRDFGHTCIEAIDGSVRGLLSGRQQLGLFDFVYAAGLYDYLTDKVSIKLTQRCLDMLKPGGTFLFANFSQDIGVDGYMESFMNWALLLRTEQDMWNIINSSADPLMIEAEVFFGENRNIVYGVIRKKV
ncbi:class I SAM-dependent methyltransferase [Rhizobium sp. Leaf262]|uniref:class I SAM-dependent methyltransferase n=1 Tax=Rhizobium sp. Leaf262 TaxID=1736312 RepID=UPI00071492B6|nr:class I SAM-dependent methyltransferase [Rhizobium sp. Leaf262]KQO77660.1 methyltransferase [Rhizobium sp. Leaf262]